MEQSSPIPPARQGWPNDAGEILTGYFWFLLKNVFGWGLMLSSIIIGTVSPLPIGFPIFLIGFAMIYVPGKRHLTSRVLRGRRFVISGRIPALIFLGLNLVLPALALWYVSHIRVLFPSIEHACLHGLICYGIGILVTMALMLLGEWIANRLVRFVPAGRRKVRPFLRSHGIDLLPPRWTRRRHSESSPSPCTQGEGRGEGSSSSNGAASPTAQEGTLTLALSLSTGRGNKPGRKPDNEILHLDVRYKRRMKYVVKSIFAIAITAGIFWWMFKPVHEHWSEVRGSLHEIDWGLFALAAVMFAIFLFVFRAISWWRIVDGLGHRLPIPAATRIWSTSELARYIPGAIWQVVGRVYLVKPYGVSGSVCSTSQILELTVFLLANVLMAVTCLLWYGTKIGPAAKPFLYGCMALTPVLLGLLHPRIFYGLINRILQRIKKPAIVQQLQASTLFKLVIWAILGLLWQSLAIWLITHGPLHLQLAKWWVVAGAYCLAWCVGFIAFWAPAGFGVREGIFMAAMTFAAPAAVRQHFADQGTLRAFLALLAVVLRLWTIAGEIIVATIAYSLDYRGALGLPGAPGRQRLSETAPESKITA